MKLTGHTHLGVNILIVMGQVFFKNTGAIIVNNFSWLVGWSAVIPFDGHFHKRIT